MPRIRPASFVRLAILLAIAALLDAPATALADPALATGPATYYVRVDGGDPTQCTGLADAPYPGSGVNQPCAWRHPFDALPPEGAPRIAGGDTLIIGAGSYRMGYGADGAEACSSDYPWACHMPPIPSGPDAAHRTRILSVPGGTELWGCERADLILNLTGSSHVEISGLEITDHSSCVEHHAHAGGGSELTCQRDAFPYGDWAAVGLYAEDSHDVTLRDLDIHGLADAGIRAGRLSDWLVEDVRVSGNGWVGWDGDIPDDDWNSGDLVFRRFVVTWNGCAETWPGEEPTGCWGQVAGGYGDGLGTGATGGDWLFEEARFEHNTSDGLDLLYCRAPSTVTIRRTLAAGNAGNQLKTNGPAAIENSVVVGNCAYFQGQPFTHRGDFDNDGIDESAVDDCRALGNALSLTLRRSDAVTLTHNTVIGQGDCLVLAESDGSFSGSERVTLRNNILLGEVDYLGGDRVCLIYSMGFPHDPVDMDYTLVAGCKNNACPGDHVLCEVDPRLVDGSLAAFDARLLADSPAIDWGDPAVGLSDDFAGNPRDASPDLGAFEWRATHDIALPLIVGWNLIALPELDGPTAVPTALADIAGAYDLVYAHDGDGWRVHNALGDPANDTLAAVDHTMGLWVRASSPVTLTQRAPVAARPVALHPGWNLVAAPWPEARPAGVAFGEDIALAYAYEPGAPSPWALYAPDAPGYVNTLDVVAPGRGYWVSATAACLWEGR